MRLFRGSTALAVAALAACSSGSTSPNPDSTANEQTVGIGPLSIAAGEETTVCIVIPFGNTVDMVADSIDVNLAPGSHHLIVYKTDASPTTTPYPCSPFSGIVLGSDTPLLLANKEQESWTFPKGVAQLIPANTYVKIEAHYINATAQTIQGKGQVTFHGSPKTSAPAFQPAGFTFWGTTHIDIPPNSTASTPMLFQAGIPGTHLISVTTHQHRLGTGIQVWESDGAGQRGTQLADDLDWSNPSWGMISPSYAFNGNNGLSYQCSWTNTTDQTVTFGESALDEMCFVGGYYYPSMGKGLDLCINGGCLDRQ